MGRYKICAPTLLGAQICCPEELAGPTLTLAGWWRWRESNWQSGVSPHLEMFKTLRFYAGFSVQMLHSIPRCYASLRKNKDQIKANKDQAFCGSREAGKRLSSQARINVWQCQHSIHLCKLTPLVHKYLLGANLRAVKSGRALYPRHFIKIKFYSNGEKIFADYAFSGTRSPASCGAGASQYLNQPNFEPVTLSQPAFPPHCPADNTRRSSRCPHRQHPLSIPVP